MSDQQLVDALNALVRPKRRKELKALEARGALPGRRASAQYKAPATGAGGIASPLTEKTKYQGGQQVADREYYAAGQVSSDGLLVLPAVKKWQMLDANGAEVVFEFAQPGTLQ